MKVKNVTLSDRIRTSNVKEGYYVTVKYMYGETNEYCKEEYGPFPEDKKDYLIEFLNMLEDCLEIDDRGFDGNYHNSVKLLKVWDLDYDFENKDNEDERLESLMTEDKLAFINEIDFEWPICPDSLKTQAIIMYYNVKYYDEVTDIWYCVKVEKTTKDD